MNNRIITLWNTAVWQHPERWSRLVFLLYLTMYPGTIITLLLMTIPPEARGFGGVFLVLQGTAVACWLWHWLGKSAIWPIVIIMSGAFAVEYVGATFDIPFGSYDYTTVLGPQLAGTVPVVIVFAWLMVVVGAWQITQFVRPWREAWWWRILGSGLVVMLFDLQIEPVATHIHGYWYWVDQGPYYGVPTVNFFGWWLVGSVLAAATDRWLRRISPPASVLPVVAMMASCGMFTVMNLQSGYPIAGVWALLSLVLVYGTYRRWR